MAPRESTGDDAPHVHQQQLVLPSRKLVRAFRTQPTRARYLDLIETSWLEPDIAVYRVPAHDGTSWWRDFPAPLLVVEILSPSTTKTDRHYMRPAYFEHGVGEVWLVVPDARTIARWTTASEFSELYRCSMRWSPIPNAVDFEIAEAELFGAR